LEHSDFDKSVNEQLKYWQGLLKLSDWDIKVDYWPHEALGSDTLAKVLWSRNQKTATLALRVPADIPAVERGYSEGEAIDYDITILHELLHLKCVDLESKVEWAEEQLVNHVAKALVQLYREANPSETIVEGPQPTKHGHYI